MTVYKDSVPDDCTESDDEKESTPLDLLQVGQSSTVLDHYAPAIISHNAARGSQYNYHAFRPFGVIPERGTFNASGGSQYNYYIERFWSRFALCEHTQTLLSSNPGDVSMEQVEEVD